MIKLSALKRDVLIFFVLALVLVLFFVLDLFLGPTHIDFATPVGMYIFMNLRLPKALTALLAGVALSISGMMMQTLFRNPLAGPSILGVSSGATFGVSLVIMLGSLLGFNASGGAVVFAAIFGAMVVLMLVLLVSFKVKSNVSLLIVGMMIGSIASAFVSVIQNYSNPDSLKLFVVWTLGSLSSVGWKEMCVMLPVITVGVIISIGLIKVLNGLILGENYAQGLGIRISRVRFFIILSTGLLAGGITAFCGPIAFIGVAVPHIARGLLRTSDHRLTLLSSALVGADLLLVCDIVSGLFTYPLPISTVSALFGAPIIIWILFHNTNL